MFSSSLPTTYLIFEIHLQKLRCNGVTNAQKSVSFLLHTVTISSLGYEMSGTGTSQSTPLRKFTSADTNMFEALSEVESFPF